MTNEDISFSFTIEELAMDAFPNTEYKSCFSPDCDISPFVTNTSMMSMLLGTEDIVHLDTMKGKNARVSAHVVETPARPRTWKKYMKNGGYTSSESSSDASSDSSDDSVDSPRSSSPKNASPRRTITPNTKIRPKDVITKNHQILSEEEKRQFVMNLNQMYANQLKHQKDMVVESFREWKQKESARMECSKERKKWEYLNKKYTTLKRRNAREIYDKVQSVNRKMNIPSNVYDMHGQGVKCGNFEYILKRILKNADKKKEVVKKGSSELVKVNTPHSNNTSTIILDIGTKKDGEWHQQALESTVTYLKSIFVQYEIDNTNRYITVHP